MDDHNETRWYDKRILESMLKKISANPDVPVEAKFMDALNVRDLFRVVVLLFNTEGTGGSHLIPPLAEDSEGKVSIFRTQRADLPMGSTQFKEIRKITRGKAMPAFLYWLDHEFVPRAEILSGDRFQIKGLPQPGRSRPDQSIWRRRAVAAAFSTAWVGDSGKGRVGRDRGRFTL